MGRIALCCLICLTTCASARAESYAWYTLRGWYEWSDAMVVAKRVEPANTTPKSGQKVTYRVTEVLKTDGPDVKPGNTITFTYRKQKFWRPQMANGALVVFKGERRRRDDNKSPMWWWPQHDASKGIGKYIKEAPAMYSGDKKRGAYFLRFLEHAETPIAADAFYEFSQLRYERATWLAPLMKRDRIRRWLENPETPVNRWGMYGILLGRCGNTDDARLLKKMVANAKPDDFRFIERYGLEGLMAGYLLITGERGLPFIETTMRAHKWWRDKLGQPRLYNDGTKIPAFIEPFAALRAFETIHRYFPKRIAHERLLKSIRMLLENKEINDSVVGRLTHMKDWKVQDRLMREYGVGRFERKSVRRSIVDYMVHSTKDIPRGRETDPPPHVVKGRKYLAAIRKKDPKTVAFVDRYLKLMNSPEKATR